MISKLLIFTIDITKKEFGRGDKNGKESAMWRNREKDWYNAERRFIFATNTKALRKEWIKNIMIEKDPERTSHVGEKPQKLEL